ncbi:ubiquitin protein ligase, partial [Ochromonadaceae sp. CCMP2298]
PYFVLAVRRVCLLKDALRITSDASDNDLRKPLKVVFLGEEGIDEGGVTKEFFQLLVGQFFSPAYGLFEPAPSGRASWPLRGTYCNHWCEHEYRLVGTLLGLAVYNDVLLDAHFPPLFYQKLLPPYTPQLSHLLHLDPELYKGLKQLLEFDPDHVEAVYCRTFTDEWEEFGTKCERELVPGGSTINVTGANRLAYVAKLVAWRCEGAVAEQFRALYGGFSRVVHRSALELLTASELELVMVGTPHLDFQQLEQHCECVGWEGDGGHPTIRAFWAVLHSLPFEEKQKFLQFVTGSTKAPIGGLRNIGLKIQRMGPHSASLPTAHTCFNTLLLPAYEGEQVLRERLVRAIRECEGFGLK